MTSGMDAVKILADRIDQRMAELGLNDNQLSLAVSNHGFVVRDIRRGSMPGAVRLQMIADKLETTTTWLLGDGEADAPAAPAPLLRVPTNAFPLTVADGHAAPPRQFKVGDLPKNVPVYSGAMGTSFDFGGRFPIEAQTLDLGEHVDMVRRPPGIADAKGAYAIYIVGDSQSPRFDSGELAFVHPHRPVSAGDDVVVQLRDDDDRVACALVKRLLRRTLKSVRLRQFNPAIDFDVPQSRITAIHRILPNADLWGV